jgi:hypothetical protein
MMSTVGSAAAPLPTAIAAGGTKTAGRVTDQAPLIQRPELLPFAQSASPSAEAPAAAGRRKRQCRQRRAPVDRGFDARKREIAVRD